MSRQTYSQNLGAASKDTPPGLLMGQHITLCSVNMLFFQKFSLDNIIVLSGVLLLEIMVLWVYSETFVSIKMFKTGISDFLYNFKALYWTGTKAKHLDSIYAILRWEIIPVRVWLNLGLTALAYNKLISLILEADFKNKYLGVKLHFWQMDKISLFSYSWIPHLLWQAVYSW